MRCRRRTEAGLHSLDHQVPDHLARDAGGRADIGDGFAVTGIQHERDPNLLAVPARDLEGIRAPARVGAQGDHFAIVVNLSPAASMPGQQQAVLRHQAVDPLVIDGGIAVSLQLTVQKRCHAPVTA